MFSYLSNVGLGLATWQTVYMVYISSFISIFFGTILTAFIKSEKYYDFASLLENRNNIEFATKLKQQTKNGVCPNLLQAKNYVLFYKCSCFMFFYVFFDFCDFPDFRVENQQKN